jgi:hypothetical protein
MKHNATTVTATTNETIRPTIMVAHTSAVGSMKYDEQALVLSTDEIVLPGLESSRQISKT